jgi:hypothetical protein
LTSNSGAGSSSLPNSVTPGGPATPHSDTPNGSLGGDKFGGLDVTTNKTLGSTSNSDALGRSSTPKIETKIGKAKFETKFDSKLDTRLDTKLGTAILQTAKGSGSEGNGAPGSTGPPIKPPPQTISYNFRASPPTVTVCGKTMPLNSPQAKAAIKEAEAANSPESKDGAPLVWVGNQLVPDTAKSVKAAYAQLMETERANYDEHHPGANGSSGVWTDKGSETDGSNGDGAK